MRAPARCLTTRKTGLKRATRQRGQALILALLVLSIGVGALVFSFFNAAKITLESDQITSDALARAKAALIGYAVSRGDITGSARPGEFPCPDTDNAARTEAS